MTEFTDALGPFAIVFGVIVFINNLNQFLAYLIPPRPTFTGKYRPPSEAYRVSKLDQSGKRDATWRSVYRFTYGMYGIMLGLFLLVMIAAKANLSTIFQNSDDVFLLVLVFGMPLAMIVTNYLDNRRYRSTHRTRLATNMEVEIDGNREQTVEHMRRILADLGAAPLLVDMKAGKIEVKLKSSWIRVRVAQDEEAHYKVSILVDSYLPSTKFDLGANSKRMSEILAML